MTYKPIGTCRYEGCQREALAPANCTIQITLCMKHLGAAGATWNRIITLGYGLSAEAIESRKSRSQSVIYYIRRDTLVKIGTTENLDGRLTDLRPDEVLALEPGSYGLEHQRHDQFKHINVGGEWFRFTDELLDHIEEVVATRRDWARPRVLAAYRAAKGKKIPFLADAWAPLALKHPPKVA